jgi:hypothetical protein
MRFSPVKQGFFYAETYSQGKTSGKALLKFCRAVQIVSEFAKRLCNQRAMGDNEPNGC